MIASYGWSISRTLAHERVPLSGRDAVNGHVLAAC